MRDSSSLSLSGGIQVFSFWVEDVPYALRIEHVLTISQDVSGLRKVPGEVPGFIGLIDYQGTVVPVIDFAHMLGRRNERERKAELIELLSAREKDHLDWIDALEHSLRHSEPFTGERDPHRCAFGRWYDSFKPNDETLAFLLRDFDEPHKRIHALANELLDLSAHEGKEAALRQLAIERDTTLKTLRNSFDFARDNLSISQRSVLLYVTSDGRTPRMALNIDNISDIITFEEQDRVPLDRIALPEGSVAKDLISDYLRGKAGDCLLLDPDALIRLADHTKTMAA